MALAQLSLELVRRVLCYVDAEHLHVLWALTCCCRLLRRECEQAMQQLDSVYLTRRCTPSSEMSAVRAIQKVSVHAHVRAPVVR